MPSAGTDFYIAHIPPHPGAGLTSTSLDVLIGSEYANNVVYISYINDDYSESNAAQKLVQAGRVWRLKLDRLRMRPTRGSSSAESRGAHITSRYPVTVQVVHVGSNSGGMYQAIPTAALGTKYVVAAMNDVPGDYRSGSYVHDTSASTFLIFAPYNNTHVTYTPTTSTDLGDTGLNFGALQDSRPHPVTRTLQHGQVVWVRSDTKPPYNNDLPLRDLSNTLIVSDKPIAVLAGQESAILGDPGDQWQNLTFDTRDYMIEQMTPVECWGSDYPSIPFLPPASSLPLLRNGRGDLYRVHSLDSQSVTCTIADSATVVQSALPFQAPVAAFTNIENAVDIAANSTSPRPFSAIMYDYYQGRDSSVENYYSTPNEQTLVPIDRWLRSYVFSIIKEKSIAGSQFVNVIGSRAVLDSIDIRFNGGIPAKLATQSAVARYTIPNHPDLEGRTYRLAAGDYWLQGKETFACYSYGRTENSYYDGWGYAASCGQSYTRGTERSKPRVEVVRECDSWEILVRDSLPNDEGLAYIEPIIDSDGSIYGRKAVLYNMRFDRDSTFYPGLHAATVRCTVINPEQSASCSVYIEDRAGNDTLIQLSYTPRFDLSTRLIRISSIVDTCISFYVYNHDTLSEPLSVYDVQYDPVFHVKSDIRDQRIAGHDSTLVTFCYSSRDTNTHRDTLLVSIECQILPLAIEAHTSIGVLEAHDFHLDRVLYGDTACLELALQNYGGDTLRITGQTLSDRDGFVILDTLPIIIPPERFRKVSICYSPTSAGANDRDTIHWITSAFPLGMSYGKNESYLEGHGAPKMSVLNQSDRELDLSVHYPSVAQLSVLVTGASGSMTCSLYDILGREVYQTTSDASPDGTTVPIGVRELGKDVYIIRVENNGHVVSRRVFVR